MNKLKALVLVLFLSLVVSTQAWALQCKSGNYGSDECWTDVRVSSSETTPVIAGTVLVYDFASAEDADDAAFWVRVSSAITDGYKIAGVAQGTIATGDKGRVLVRGKGDLRVATSTTSGDRLYVSSTAGTATGTNTVAADSAASRDKVLAFALETSGSASTQDAFITVI